MASVVDMMGHAECRVLSFPPTEPKRERTAHFGTALFLLASSMVFAELFALAGAGRVGAAGSAYTDLPILWPSAGVLVALLSSSLLRWGLARIRVGQTAQLPAVLIGCALLGLAFVGLQTIIWAQLGDLGIHLTGSRFASSLFALTWLQTAHVIVGIAAFGTLAFKIRRGIYSPLEFLSVRLWAMYWHFCTAVGCTIFLAVFVF